MNDPFITIVGNLGGPPRLKVVGEKAVPVADFRVAVTPRRADRQGDWSDGETIWFTVTAWRALGEHCAASLKKGDRVTVSGELTTRSWEVEGGERRSGLEISARTVGLELSRSDARSLKPPVLVPGEDPWVSSGVVDPETGEVLMEPQPLAAVPEPSSAAA